MTVSIPESANEAELVDIIASSIADAIGVHPSKVAVTVDMDSGDVEFLISTEEFNEGANAQFNLENAYYRDEIVNSIEDD
eukprot:UN06703